MCHALTSSPHTPPPAALPPALHTSSRPHQQPYPCPTHPPSPMACRVDKVEAAVDSVVHNVAPVEAALVLQVSLELLIDVRDDALVAVSVVYCVTIAGGIHDSEPHLDAALLYLDGAHVDLNSLLDVVWRRVIIFIHKKIH